MAKPGGEVRGVGVLNFLLSLVFCETFYLCIHHFLPLLLSQLKRERMVNAQIKGFAKYKGDIFPALCGDVKWRGVSCILPWW